MGVQVDVSCHHGQQNLQNKSKPTAAASDETKQNLLDAVKYGLIRADQRETYVVGVVFVCANSQLDVLSLDERLVALIKQKGATMDRIASSSERITLLAVDVL